MKSSPTSRSYCSRAFKSVFTGLLAFLLVSATQAAENCFPRGKSVSFVIPYSIGSLENFYARMMKTVAEEAIGSQFNPKNVPARGGIEGMTELFDARPSGGTLGMLNAADVIVAALAGAVPFEPGQFTIFGRIVDSPQALYVSRPTFAKGISSAGKLAGSKSTLSWGITSPASFFAAAILDNLLDIGGKFERVGVSAEAAMKAADQGKIDLLVLDTHSSDHSPDREIIPLLALGPRTPEKPLFEQHGVPLLEQIVKSADREKALALAHITVSGLIIAGPRYIPSLRAECIQAAFRKALEGPKLQALARAANRPIEPLDAEATEKLIEKAAKAALPFKTAWLEALEKLKNSH